MARSPVTHLLWLLLAVCFTGVHSTGHMQAQFYDQSTKYAVAITSALLGGGTQAWFLIEAPVSYGWAAVGSGSIMDGSLMFIIYPDETGQNVTFSARTSSGHDTPKLLQNSKVNATLLESSIKDGTMSALIQLVGEANGFLYNGCSVSNTKQPWIWAVGPNQKIASNDPDFHIQQHNSNGAFFADMTESQNPAAAAPFITGTSNMNVQAQPDYYFNLIVVHACLLAGAFVIVFPAAVVALRLNLALSFKMHWIAQLVATVAIIAGLGVAIFASIIGIQYSSLTQPHQLVGIVLCALVGLQIYLGREHHIHFVLHRKRSFWSYGHMFLGRLLMYGGIINASLGLKLAGQPVPALGVLGLGLVILIIVETMSAIHNIRRRKKQVANYEPLGLKDLRMGKNAEVTVEEQMLINTNSYSNNYSNSYSNRR